MKRENKTFAKLLFRYGDKDLVQVVTWPLAVLHRPIFPPTHPFEGDSLRLKLTSARTLWEGFVRLTLSLVYINYEADYKNF